jgi:integrase
LTTLRHLRAWEKQRFPGVRTARLARAEEPLRGGIGILSGHGSEADLRFSDYLFPSRVKQSRHLSVRQYARIVHRWIDAIGLDPSGYGTHSMRRTKASLIYRRTKNLRAVQLLLGHTKLESTVRCLGVEFDDALELAEQTEA